MKIRKLVAATDVENDVCCEPSGSCSTLSAQEDYTSAIDCIQNAINFLAHTAQCNSNDVVAKESIANLAVVLLDLKSSYSDASTTSEEIIPISDDSASLE